MARKLRIQHPGAVYHVMNLGDRREAIFGDDEDRQRLLETLTEACQKTGWQVQAQWMGWGEAARGQRCTHSPGFQESRNS